MRNGSFLVHLGVVGKEIKRRSSLIQKVVRLLVNFTVINNDIRIKSIPTDDEKYVYALPRIIKATLSNDNRRSIQIFFSVLFAVDVIGFADAITNICLSIWVCSLGNFWQ